MHIIISSKSEIKPLLLNQRRKFQEEPFDFILEGLASPSDFTFNTTL